jgi:hypothetical protein
MAQTAPRKIQERAGVDGGHPIAANSPPIHEGALVILKSGEAIPGREGQGADNAAKAAEAATFAVVGIAKKSVTVADKTVPTRAGCFLFANKADDAVTRADITKACFVFDDETVARTNPNNIRATAGTVIDVESVGVWVRVGA